MSDRLEPRDENLFKALQVIGLGISETKVLTTMINMQTSKPSEIIRITGLSRGTVYSSLETLVDEGYLERQETHPITYAVVSGTLQKVATELDRVRKSLVRVSYEKLKESPAVLEEICRVFERTGFAIRELPPNIMKRQRSALRIKRIAEGEYSIGILVYDRGVNRALGRELHLPLTFLISENQMVVGAITTFVFIHPNFKEASKVYNDFTKIVKLRRHFPGSATYGITDKPFFVFRTTDDVSEGIVGAILEIRRRRTMVTELVRRLKDQLSQVEHLIDACREHGREIEEMILGKYRAFTLYASITKEVRKIADPVERIRNREIRNLQIFKNRFNRVSVKVSNNVDAFERRTFLPSPYRLENSSKELEMIASKLTPIEFELNDLRENLFSYASSFLLSKKARMAVPLNPFMFTEPYERDNFFVDQEEVTKRAPDLASAIIESRADTFNILTGPAGCGKTHALKYIYEPTMEKCKIKTFYLDCPVSYDLIECFARELVQETNYPPGFSEMVRSLRKNIPQMPGELVALLGKIRDILKTAGKTGILVEIDEFENMLPYPEEIRPIEEEGRRPPLALRQLQEILKRSIDNVGYVISLREKAYPQLDRSLGVINLNKFTIRPDKLTRGDLQDIIKRRYEVWKVDGPPFDEGVIVEIINRIDGNARNAIRYCREIFKFAVRNGLKRIDLKTLRSVKEIPIFYY